MSTPVPHPVQYREIAVDDIPSELWVIAVLPEFEGRGIGAALMPRAERWLWQSGCSRA